MIKSWAPSVRFSPLLQLAMNKIIGQKRLLSFKFLEHDCCLEWEPRGVAYIPKVVCNGLWNGSDFSLFLEDLPPLEQLDVSFKNISWENLDPELRSVLFESLLQSILLSLKLALKGEVSIEAITILTSPPAIVDNSFNLPFQIKTPSSKLRGYGSFPTTVLNEFLKIFDQIPAISDISKDSILSKMPVPFLLEIGASRCDPQTLKKLNLNDIFLLDNDSWFKAGHLLLTYQRFCFAATLENNYIRLGDFMEKENDNLPVGTIPEEGEGEIGAKSGTESTSAPEAQEPPEAEIPTVLREPQKLPFERLPITITFDLGSKSFALNEVGGFAPGFTFELDRSLESPVDIRANGTKIASGELVTINDRLGVRILSFYANNG